MDGGLQVRLCRMCISIPLSLFSVKGGREMEYSNDMVHISFTGFLSVLRLNSQPALQSVSQSVSQSVKSNLFGSVIDRSMCVRECKIRGRSRSGSGIGVGHDVYMCLCAVFAFL